MPELPQMQALAERLTEAFGGAELRDAIPLQFAALKTVRPGPEVLRGRTLTGVGRRGKFLVLRFGGPRALVHLSQGGRVIVEPSAKATRPKQGVVRFVFPGRPGWLVREFGTERKAGWWVLAAGDDGPLARLGPEPSSDEFRDLLLGAQDRRHLHTFLRDQRTVAGIGRGYADDVLHRARLSPYATLASLDATARRALFGTVAQVLDEALAKERTRSGGLPPKLSDHFTVHGHAGEPCPACGEDLRRISFESREVTYCPSCQTGGTILADRRMSRLIK
ncbi:MAG TPA: DNA-formamidopyrimidine glycosylase family protein [Actinomycetota bacterium]